MKRLFITEKASVGRALSNVLAGEKQKEENHIRCGDDVVAWASGHLLELFEPQDYDEVYSKWQLDTLPIIPKEWKLKEISRTKHLLQNIGKLLKQADSVVHGGDGDREGQLLVDEILEYFDWKGPTQRLLINDVNPDAIRKALKAMRDNADYRGEFFAGRARSRADYVAGINLTRYCTIHFENAGYEAGNMFSVGRVQTPTLGLVVRRDREIAHFVSKPYYELHAMLTLTAGNRKISGRWISGEKETPFLDEEGRLIDGAFCEKLEAKLIGATGTILDVDKKMRKQAPPLPYNLAQLQMDAGKKYDITDTLSHAQKLYERGYVTYPRSYCRYIPEGHHAEAPKILQAIEAGCSDLHTTLKAADATRKSPAWDDSRVTEHHAILPTTKVPLENALSEKERKIYDLICTRYVLQFLPDHEYRETTVEFEAAGERFKTSGREVVALGWKGAAHCEDDEDKAVTDAPPFPTVVVGESGPVVPRVEERKTTPPKQFTYDALIFAMNSIYLYVEDTKIRRQLKELDGIGTSATQEHIVSVLFERGYIEKRKKGRGPAQIFSTPAGQILIDTLNAGKASMLVKPELTAIWEQKMTQIEKGELDLETFVSEVAAMVGEIVKAPLVVPEMPELPRRKKCPTEGCDGYLIRKTGAYGPFFFCPACKHVYREREGEPAPTSAGSEVIEADCPLGCGKKARRFDGKYGHFWKCFCSPNVKFKDVDGKPAVPEERAPSVSAKCPVKRCKGTAVQYRAKADGRLFWKCETCKNFFDDADGKPVVRESRRESKKQKIV
ncbi:MAG: DNA topoisomerase 3 [Synergistaceae bacterium]|jgi:DNA topoisomerase-3|nr:DNA topoisomerase 3 [Synergistaceae bacterium]